MNSCNITQKLPDHPAFLPHLEDLVDQANPVKKVKKMVTKMVENYVNPGLSKTPRISM